MHSEFDSAPPEPKDYTRALWVGVLVLVVAMIAVMFYLGARQDAGVSRVRARHILITYNKDDVTDRARAIRQAKDLLARLKNGEDFAALALEYSSDKDSARNGGDLGWSRMRTYDKNIEEYVWKAPLNTPSEVLQTDFGYHIVEVTAREIAPQDAYLFLRDVESAGGASSGAGS